MKKDEIEYIMNILRRGTLAWSGRNECLKSARQPVHEGKFNKAGEPILKFHWQCAHCLNWFRDESSMEVDHVEEVGGFKGNWHEWVERLYCRPENLQALCNVCHLKKTSKGNAKSRFERKTKV